MFGAGQGRWLSGGRGRIRRLLASHVSRERLTGAIPHHRLSHRSRPGVSLKPGASHSHRNWRTGPGVPQELSHRSCPTGTVSQELSHRIYPTGVILATGAVSRELSWRPHRSRPDHGSCFTRAVGHRNCLTGAVLATFRTRAVLTSHGSHVEVPRESSRSHSPIEMIPESHGRVQ